MRELCGKGTYTAIPVEDFGKDFMLASLIKASAIIVDENNTDIFVDKVANFKAVVTKDVILLNRKFKQPISYRFRGFMVQCVNDLPKFKDKTGSFYRRQLIVPFDKCFTGHERKYIKDDYLHRPEVLEYVLYKVLNMNYYNLDEPEICRDTLFEFKGYNDPIYRFVMEIFPKCQWSFLPKEFLYDLFSEWYSVEYKQVVSFDFQEFVKRSKNVVQDEFPNEYVWGRHQGGARMNFSEPLIDEYDLSGWCDHNSHTCVPPKSVRDKQYTGFLKIVTGGSADV